MITIPLKFTGRRCLAGMRCGKRLLLRTPREEQFKVEFECEFIGSVDTLISPMALEVYGI